MSVEALTRAVEIAGGQSALARHLKVSQAAVWHWLNKPIPVPAEHVAGIELATAGKVTRHDLRPDLWPQNERAA